MNKLKIFIILIFIFSNNLALAEYHKANLEESELDIDYQEYEFKEREDKGLLKNLISNIDNEAENTVDEEKKENSIFPLWILIISLIIILFILIRLFKKISVHEKKFHRNRLMIIKAQDQITQDDEITYTNTDSKIIKPQQEKIKDSNIKLKTKSTSNKEKIIEAKLPKKIEVKIQEEKIGNEIKINKSNEEILEIENIDLDKEDEEYIFED